MALEDDGFSFMSTFPAFDLYSTYELLHILCRAIESVPQAVAIVDLSLNVQYMNHRMKEVVEASDAFVLVDGTLRAQDMTAQFAISAAVTNACTTVGNDGASSVIAVPDPAGKRACQASVRSLAGSARAASSAPEIAMICVTCLQSEPAWSPDHLNDLFGFSTRETDLVNRLVAGHEVNRIARVDEVDVTSVEEEIANLLDKTGCQRQSELVSVLSQLRNIQ